MPSPDWGIIERNTKPEPALAATLARFPEHKTNRIDALLPRNAR